MRPSDCGVIAVVPFSHLWCAERVRKIMDRPMTYDTWKTTEPFDTAPRNVKDAKIITSRVFPPIPSRVFDWSAHWESWEEGPYGFGPTEETAIRDLTDNYDNPDQE